MVQVLAGHDLETLRIAMLPEHAFRQGASLSSSVPILVHYSPAVTQKVRWSLREAGRLFVTEPDTLCFDEGPAALLLSLTVPPFVSSQSLLLPSPINKDELFN